MKVCVTGGLGYLGCKLVEKLTEKGFDVSIIDLKIYGNYLPEGIQEKVKIAYEDVRNLKDNGKELIKNSDVLIHLAAIVGDQACDLIKEKSVDINLNGSKNIFKLGEKFNKKIIYASTCSVYGANSNVLNEKSRVLPLSIYALTKYATENLLKESNVDYTIFRMGTLFGYSPRMRLDLVINNLLVKAITDKEIVVFGGEQWRPFLSLEDACNFYIKVLESDFFENKILNVGGINLRILDLAKKIQKITGCSIKIFKEIKDPRDYRVDSSLAKKILKLDFKVSIEDAAKEIIEAYEKGKINLKNPALNNYEYLRVNSGVL